MRSFTFTLASATVLLLSGCWSDGSDGISDGFCHGQPDGLPCDDGEACTVGDVCGNGVCTGRVLADDEPCDDGTVCTSDDICKAGVCTGVHKECPADASICEIATCDPVTAVCGVRIGEPGEACNDGDPCTDEDQCLHGICEGISKDCSVAEDQCNEGVCNPDTGGCMPDPVPDGTLCDDDNICTNDACTTGVCTGSPIDCTRFDTVCRIGVCNAEDGECLVLNKTDGTDCDDANTCTTTDGYCEAGDCFAIPFENGSECNDGDPCTVADTCDAAVCYGLPKGCTQFDDDCNIGACNPEDGTCFASPLEDGISCDDRDGCTANETCNAGACGQGDITCFCIGKSNDTPCDDGLACTLNDRCVSEGCVGTVKDCSSLDSVCELGSCDPSTGQCAALARPIGVPCDDGEACTEHDGCVAGKCVGEALDCTDLDEMCVVGVCNGGMCATEARPGGTPCDDGSPCTGQDSCTNGQCSGAIQLCTACDGMAAGDMCDDGDACTTATTCVQAGAALVCQGTPTDCSGMNSDCMIGRCKASDGTCVTVPRANGLDCNDSNACTTSDVCQAGQCVGTAVEMCGASPDACEPPANNELVDVAHAITMSGTTYTMMGWAQPAGDTDWYAVEMQAGQLLTVEVGSHCMSSLDTAIAVLAPDKATELGFNDDKDPMAMDKWSRLEDVKAEQAGTYYIAVTAYAVSGAGTYMVSIEVDFPPPCSSDADCGCAQLRCDGGACKTKATGETEPNDTAEDTASALTFPGSAAGELLSQADVDRYTVTLTAGAPVAFQTAALCSAHVDPSVLVIGPGGDPISFDDDSAGGGQARALLMVPADGDYIVEVAASSDVVGKYVLEALDLRCQSDMDCNCPDQTCGAGGLCGPKATKAEPANATDPPPSLASGDRFHAAIDVPYDSDRYSLSLPPGTYDIKTLPYCGADTDTILTLWDQGGASVIATDDNGGDGTSAALMGYVVTSTTTYLLEVQANGPVVGGYLLAVEPVTTP